MSQLRRDPIIGRWNIIEAEPGAAPAAFEVEVHAPMGSAMSWEWVCSSEAPAERPKFLKMSV